MNILAWINSNLIWTEGAQILLVTLLCGLGAFLFYRPLLYVVVAFLVFTFYFFRNPERVCPQAHTDATILVCPADGKVVAVDYDPLGALEGAYTYKVSIFLSPFDVHVNWSPVAGTIERVVYKPGTFTLAFLPKSSLLNERNDIYIKAPHGQSLVVRQIAGTVARRICCWVQPHDAVTSCSKIGMIRFGSRVDILLPKEVDLQVSIGQRVYGGQTILGRWTCV